ncbi:MAG TPA: SIS domain-containing protein [Anaerolineae bacterium]|nr:SIS domain-containing protein [Anaerolineae bacterium]HQI83230.1 SIS domain-containing protein [Anaerolineae bacterium]
MDYFEAIINLLQEVRETQREAMERAAVVMADAIQADHLIYAFGPTHAGILAQELFYRAGGLVPINPILPPGLTTDVRPSTLTSRLERMPGLAAHILAETPLEAGDVLIVHSVSGRNAVAVEMAQGARERGVFVIAVTSLRYSSAVQPRQVGMPRLFEVADLVLDNRAPIGDALVALPGLPQNVGPSSTITGAALLNAVVVRVAELLLERTGDPPVFMSANLDGGDVHNRRWLEHYRGRLTYL